MFIAKLNKLSLVDKYYLTDPLNFIGIGIALLINIIHVTFLYFKIGWQNSTILLHYNVVYGPDFVEKATMVYLVPLTAFIILIINATIAGFFYRKEKLPAYFLNFATIAVQLIFLVAAVMIVRINA